MIADVEVDSPIVLGFLDFIQRNWALVGIVGTLVILVSVPIFVLRKYLQIIANLFYDSPIPLAVEARDYERPEGEIVEFRAFDGHRLRGILISPTGGAVDGVGGPPDQPRGTIIFCHELGSDMFSAGKYCAALLAAGYEIFSFDFRGQGESATEAGYTPRLWPSDREQADVLGAIAFVEDYLERQGRRREIGLVGISRGAGAALVGAVNVHSVKAIMTDGGFSTDAFLEYLMQRWVSIFAKVRLVYENHPPSFWQFLRWLSIRKVSRQLDCRFPSARKSLERLGPIPMLVVHGQKDGLIPSSHGRMIYDLAQGPKYLWICPKAKHNQAVSVEPDLYGGYSVRFFDRHLCGVEVDDLDREGLLNALAQPLSSSRRGYAHYTKPKSTRRRQSARRRP